MLKKVEKGIRSRLTTAFLVLSLGPLLLSGVVLAWQSSRIQLDQFLQQQHEISQRAQGRITDYFHNIDDQLGMVGGANDILGLDRDRQKKILSRMRSYRNEYHGHIYDVLILLDKNGRELVRVGRNRIYTRKDPVEMTGADEFRLPMKNGEVYYSPVTYDKRTGEPSMTVGMPMTDVRTGQMDGILVAGIGLKDIWGIVAGLQVGNAGSAFLLDSTGRVIAHRDHSLVLKGVYFSPHGNGIQRGLTDARAIVDTEEIKLGSQRLFLVTERPLSEALALTFRIVGIIGVFLVITLSGAIALGLLIRHQVIGPIESLADAVKAISGGDLTRRAQHTAADEIGIVVDSCNIMTKQLIETIDSLTSENAERRKAEALLLETARKAEDEKARSDAIIGGIADGLSIQDRDFRIMYQNQVHKNWFGDRIGEYCFNAYENREDVCDGCSLALTLQDGKLHRAERASATANGLMYLDVATSPLRDAAGQIVSVIEISRDITERRNAEEALWQTQERLVAVLDGLEAIVYVSDLETYEILFINKYTRETFGDVSGRICWQAFQCGQEGPCGFCVSTDLLTSEGKPRGGYTWECRNTINDRWYYVQDRAIHWVDGRMVRLAIATDITHRKEAEEKTKASLLEKEMLLREIHHRVKNNMQVISSLLDIQAGYVADKAVAEMFGKSRDRIRTMALIHEKLYGSKDMAQIDFAEYLRDLADYVYNLYVTDPEAVRLEINVGTARLDINMAVPVALIVHELFSNALIHAFPQGGKGRISIDLSADETGEFTLVIADNGAGLPAGLDPVKADSLGIQLVNTLVRQLKGNIEIGRSSGTAFKITFRQQEQRKRRKTGV
jgi:PAS domain S-box-containing protein